MALFISALFLVSVSVGAPSITSSTPAIEPPPSSDGGSLTFSAQVSQTSFDIGAIAEISAALLEYAALPTGRAVVWAEVQRPGGGAVDVISLAPGAMDRYVATYAMPVAGLYTVRVRARGETIYGMPFEREQTFTATATPGGDHWSPQDPHARCPVRAARLSATRCLGSRLPEAARGAGAQHRGAIEVPRSTIPHLQRGRQARRSSWEQPVDYNDVRRSARADDRPDFRR